MSKYIQVICLFLGSFLIYGNLFSQCEAGSLFTSDSLDLVYTCPGDGQSDSITFVSNGNSDDPIQLVLTNFADLILGYPNGNTIDFEPSGDGLSKIYAVSYQDQINKPVGVPITAVTFSDSCFDVSSNFVTIIRDQANAGTLTANSSTIDTFTFCTGDGMDDIINLEVNGISAAQFSYVVTDENNIILDFPDTNVINFEGIGNGTCNIWAISWTGNQLIGIGDDLLNDPISDECDDISDNHITIIRNFTDGGLVSTVDNLNSVFTCNGDGNDDVVLFKTTTTAQNSYIFIITNSDDIIVAISASANFNFEGAGFGICKVYGLSFTGTLSISPNSSIFGNQLSTGCFSLSNNFIEVIRDEPGIGFLNNPASQSDTAQICLANGNASVRITVDGLSNTPYRFIITDTSNVVLGFSDTTIIDFSGAGNGICNVWGVSYTGNFTIQVGEDLDSTDVSDDCFAISENFLQFERINIDVGTIESNVDGDVFYTCPQDGTPDIITLNAQTSIPDSQYIFIVTDTNFVILDIVDANTINFDAAPAGICLIWGLAYQDSLLAEVGMRADRNQLAEGCFALTPNSIQVIRETPEGGNVNTPNGTQVFICNQDQSGDVITFNNANTSNGAYRYIVTDESNVILSLPDGNNADFNDAPTGTCRVWGLAFTGSFTASIGDRADVVNLSDDCFDLSNNFIEVVRDRPRGGAIFTVDDLQEVDLCVGDEMPDFVEFKATANSNSPYVFIVTDDNDIILEILENNFQNFEGAGPGTCRVYGVSYTGTLDTLIGANINLAQLSDDCFNLSSGYITINRFNTGPICNTSIEELNILKENLMVYPNPTTDFITISNSSQIRIEGFSVLNINGQVLETFPRSNAIQVSNFSAGIYILRIRSEYGSVYRKIVIE